MDLEKVLWTSCPNNSSQPPTTMTRSLICFLILLDFPFIVVDASSTCSVAFAAGGFGSNKPPAKRKKKKKGGLSDFDDSPKVVPIEDNKKEPEQLLDKWGLPPVTQDDLFPPLPAGTELRSITENKEYTLRDIKDCLKGYIDLNLEKCFDDNGVEKEHNSNKAPSDISSRSSLKMKLNLLHESPPVLSIDNFLTPQECEQIQQVATSGSASQKVDSATFAGSLSTRTSTSWFSQFSDVPVLLAKAHHLLNIQLEPMEEPQIVRYQRGQEFSWHYDEVPKAQLENGGQRVATLLVYLNDVAIEYGGGTTFRDLKTAPSFSSEDDAVGVTMQPQGGSALLFFPAFADGTPDDRTLHKSEIMTACDDDTEKWIVQMWVHQHAYQAVLPPGNSNTAARPAMEQMMEELGYTNTD